MQEESSSLVFQVRESIPAYFDSPGVMIFDK
jgi:hypothetical protein